MKEYIDREVTLNLLEKINPVDFGSIFDYSAHGAVNECLRDIRYGVESLPADDVSEVVRCRECDNHSEVDGRHYCKFWRMYCPDDSEFFCKAGRRKEADHGVSEP